MTGIYLRLVFLSLIAIISTSTLFVEAPGPANPASKWLQELLRKHGRQDDAEYDGIHGTYAPPDDDDVPAIRSTTPTPRRAHGDPPTFPTGSILPRPTLSTIDETNDDDDDDDDATIASTGSPVGHSIGHSTGPRYSTGPRSPVGHSTGPRFFQFPGGARANDDEESKSTQTTKPAANARRARATPRPTAQPPPPPSPTTGPAPPPTHAQRPHALTGAAGGAGDGDAAKHDAAKHAKPVQAHVQAPVQAHEPTKPAATPKRHGEPIVGEPAAKPIKEAQLATITRLKLEREQEKLNAAAPAAPAPATHGVEVEGPEALEKLEALIKKFKELQDLRVKVEVKRIEVEVEVEEKIEVEGTKEVEDLEKQLKAEVEELEEQLKEEAQTLTQKAKALTKTLIQAETLEEVEVAGITLGKEYKKQQEERQAKMEALDVHTLKEKLEKQLETLETPLQNSRKDKKKWTKWTQMKLKIWRKTNGKHELNELKNKWNKMEKTLKRCKETLSKILNKKANITGNIIGASSAAFRRQRDTQWKNLRKRRNSSLNNVQS